MTTGEANLQARLNQAYTERTIAAVFAAKLALHHGLRAGVGTDGNEDWEPEWRVVLYIDIAGNGVSGQLSWHIAPDDQHLLEGLPKYTGKWDGSSESSEGTLVKAF